MALLCQGPKGQSSKLWHRWVGPYYISQLGPNYTAKLRRCSDNKESKSLVHFNRLKPYFDPNDRPLSPPANLPTISGDLDGDEISDEPPSPPSHDLSSSGLDPTPQTPHAPSNEPPGMWRTAKRLLTSRRYNGKMYYRVQWLNSKHSTWELAENISDALIREFHVSRTASGKKRKRPLQGWHKFFTPV